MSTDIKAYMEALAKAAPSRVKLFWRWETHGSFNLAFNAILNWNHLDAGGHHRRAEDHGPAGSTMVVGGQSP